MAFSCLIHVLRMDPSFMNGREGTLSALIDPCFASLREVALSEMQLALDELSVKICRDESATSTIFLP